MEEPRGTGREGAVPGIPEPEEGGAWSLGRGDAWTAAGWPHSPVLMDSTPPPPITVCSPSAPNSQPPTVQGGQGPTPTPASASPVSELSPSPWQPLKLCHSVSWPHWDGGLWRQASLGWPPRIRRLRGSGRGGGPQGRLPSKIWGWVGAETLGANGKTRDIQAKVPLCVGGVGGGA